MQFTLALALALVVCGAMWQQAAAHGGGLHRWAFNADVLDMIPTADIRTNAHSMIGVCSDWVNINHTAAWSSYFMPYFETEVNMTVEGTIELYTYLGGANCTNSPQSGIFPMLEYKVWNKKNGKYRSKAPKTTAISWAYTWTGSCDAPGNMYRNNETLQDDRFNILYWNDEHGAIGEGMNSSDLYPGKQWGATVNAWFPEVSAEKRIQSITIVTRGGPLMCCTVDYSGYETPESVLEKGHNCDDPSGH
eukprot:gene1304-32653_t